MQVNVQGSLNIFEAIVSLGLGSSVRVFNAGFPPFSIYGVYYETMFNWLNV